MDKVALLMTFASLLYAIGLSDIFLSIHKLIRIKNDIKWWWVPIAWSTIIVMLSASLWFATYNYLDSVIDQKEGIYLLYLSPTFFMILSCFAVLPDNPNSGLNLKEWYYKQKNYIFLLFLGLNIAQGIIVHIHFSSDTPLNTVLKYALSFGLAIAFNIVLIISKKDWVHIAITIFFFLLTLASILD